ncbi:MAG: PAS domain S-box protein [Desulfobacteraceae bacterium]
MTESSRGGNGLAHKPLADKKAGASISRRLAFGLTVAVGLVSVFTFLALYHSAIQEQEAELLRSADASRDYLVGALALPLWNFDIEAVEAICRTLLQDDRVLGLMVKDSYGADVVDIGKEAIPNGFSRTGKIFYQEELLGEVEVHFSRQFIQAAGRRLFSAYASTMLIVLLSLAILTHLLVRKFLHPPLARLNEIARPYAEGIFDSPVGVLPYAEFQPFGKVLIQLGETISAQMKERRAAEEKYRGIFENAIEGIFQSTPEGRFLNVNPSFSQIFGYASPEELIANINDIGHQLYVNPTDRDRILQDLQSRNLVQEAEVEMFCRDGGKVWVSINAHVVRDQEGVIQYFEGSLVDITKRKKYEEELRQLNEQLEQRVAERTAQLQASNRELESFCYSVSHDLRAPLRHLDGYAELLASHCQAGLDDKGVHYLNTIAASARQMGELVDALLHFSRTGRAALRKEEIDMNRVLQEALGSVQEGCDGRDIEWLIGELPTIRADYALLRQVWVNLLENSVKYTRPREIARIEVDSREEDGEIIFSVADNGVGFDMQYAANLFGVFQRLHHQKEFEGSGIGLATVQRIIDRHGGRVWAEAEPDRGARFFFSLPL